MLFWAIASIIFVVIYNLLMSSGNVVVTTIAGFFTYQIMLGIPFLFILGFSRLIKKEKRSTSQLIAFAIIPSIALAAYFFYGLWYAANHH